MTEFPLREQAHRTIRETLQILSDPEELEGILEGRKEISTTELEDLQHLLEYLNE